MMNERKAEDRTPKGSHSEEDLRVRVLLGEEKLVASNGTKQVDCQGATAAATAAEAPPPAAPAAATAAAAKHGNLKVYSTTRAAQTDLGLADMEERAWLEHPNAIAHYLLKRCCTCNLLSRILFSFLPPLLGTDLPPLFSAPSRSFLPLKNALFCRARQRGSFRMDSPKSSGRKFLPEICMKTGSVTATYWKRGKDPHPQDFSLTKKTARFTKGQFRPY